MEPVSCRSDNFIVNVIKCMEEYGTVVITDIYDSEQSIELSEQIINSILTICKLTKWTMDDLPPQTKPGLFHMLFANLHQVWEIRQNPLIVNIFKQLYTHFYGAPIDELIISGDGINIKPPTEPLHNNNNFKTSSEWAHIDQTNLSLPNCIQGQVVLEDTTAAFVASTKSHHITRHLIQKYEKHSTDMIHGGQWWKFSKKEITEIKELLSSIDGEYQVPIIAPKGSLILWFSNTIHAARLQTEIPKTIPLDNPYFGWRVVVYVCYRPKHEWNPTDLKIRQQAFENNLTTTHWGYSHYMQEKQKYHKNGHIRLLIQDPKKVYDIIGKPVLTDIGRSLLGYI